MIAEDKISEIRQASSISEFIAPHVQIRRRGRTMTALCPFHAEKTPSFSINDEKGFFHCFGCGEGGNVFKFLMRVENLSFPEAVRKVASHYGIEVVEEGQGPSSQRDQMFAANAHAARYFRRYLTEAAEAQPFRDYLERRGVDEDTAERFLVGAAPPSGDGLLRSLKRDGVEPALAATAGLVVDRDGHMRDRFWRRLMFPIRDTQGRVIGFGGRGITDDAVPKYLNSSESEVYHKSRALYGIYEAREALRDTSRLVLVEGYLDVIALAQAGIGAVVATCGTALTAEQARLIKRFAGEVVTLFDGDRAGSDASARSLPVFLEAGLWPRAATPPDGEDPDSFVRAQGAAKTNELLNRAVPVIDSYMRYVIAREGDDDKGRARAAGELAGLLGNIDNPFEREIVLKKAALWTGISEQVLATATPRAIGGRGGSGRGAAVRSQQGADEPPHPGDAEMGSTVERGRDPGRSADAAARGGAPGPDELLVTLLLADSSMIEQTARCGILEQMEQGAWKEVTARVIDDMKEGRVGDTGTYLELLGDHDRSRVARRLSEDAFSDRGVCAHMIKDCVRGIERAARKRQNRQLLSDLRKQEELGVDVASDESVRSFKPSRLPDA